jgi:4-carboxymuconolactone decarboxylase
MKKIFISILMIFISFNAFANDIKYLNIKQQSIIQIASFTANGNLDKLKIVLEEALYNNLTINEINEVLVHTYAYVGFPKSIAGLMTFLDLIEKRKNDGIKDIMGKEATFIPKDIDKNEYGAKVRAQLVGLPKDPKPSGYRAFSSIMDTFLKEHLFADIFARDILDFETRELVTISVLVSSSNILDRFIQGHMKISMRMGLTKEQMYDFVKVIDSKVGKKEGKTAKKNLDSLF